MKYKESESEYIIVSYYSKLLKATIRADMLHRLNCGVEFEDTAKFPLEICENF
jgi:hypothetical protein